MRRTAHLLGIVAVAAAVSVAAAPAGARPDALYSLSATARCLRSHGATVTSVRSTSPRLRALRDAAQRYAREVKLRTATLGLAILPSAGNTTVIAELLAVPRDPYRIVVKRNAIVMYRKADRAAGSMTLGCLKG
jgi:hypothetical protein